LATPAVMPGLFWPALFWPELSSPDDEAAANATTAAAVPPATKSHAPRVMGCSLATEQRTLATTLTRAVLGFLGLAAEVAGCLAF